MTGFGTGWDAFDEGEKEIPTGGGGSGGFEFFMKEGERRRIMFLSEVYPFFEHNFYNASGQREFHSEPCPERMRVRDDDGQLVQCVTCAVNAALPKGKESTKAGLWAKMKGAFTVIDMGEPVYAPKKDRKDARLKPSYVNDDGEEYQFQRKVYIGARGSDKKPGVLMSLRQNLMDFTGGEAVGAVFDVRRTGELTARVGDEITFIEAVEAKDIPKYLAKAGAPDDIDLEPFDLAEQFGKMSDPADTIRRLDKYGYGDRVPEALREKYASGGGGGDGDSPF
jgi:hypothetical protein